MSELDIYRRQGFGKQSGWGDRRALLVVDFMNGFTDPDQCRHHLACLPRHGDQGYLHRPRPALRTILASVPLQSGRERLIPH